MNYVTEDSFSQYVTEDAAAYYVTEDDTSGGGGALDLTITITGAFHGNTVAGHHDHRAAGDDGHSDAGGAIHR